MYHLKHWLKLFDSSVTPTMLYGAGTWIMSLERQSRTKQKENATTHHSDIKDTKQMRLCMQEEIHDDERSGRIFERENEYGTAYGNDQ